MYSCEKTKTKKVTNLPNKYLYPKSSNMNSE